MVRIRIPHSAKKVRLTTRLLHSKVTVPIPLQRTPLYINSVLYLHDSVRAKVIGVLTEVPKEENEVMRRYPCLETVFGAANRLQECEITYVDLAGTRHTFFLGLQWLPFADFNRSLRTVCPVVGWRGSILVMKKGSKAFVVNTRPSDKRNAELAVRE